MNYLKNVILIFIFFLNGCSDNQIIQNKDYVFGTIVDIKIYGETKQNADHVSNLIFNDFHRLHTYLHPWKTSAISNINQSIKQNRLHDIDDPELIQIIQDNVQLYKSTQGWFNPAIGKLVELWGFHSDLPDQKVPSEVDILDLMKNPPKMNQVIIENNMLRSENPNIQIDLGGYAKGYALKRAKKILEDNQISNALINIGGNILAIGKKGDQFWKVGIQHPRKNIAFASIQLKPGWSIGTSGDYQRYFISNNKRYSHLINPFSGYPVHHTQSATIIIPPREDSEILSDVLSKPIYLSSKEHKVKLANELQINYFLIILEDGKIMISQDMKNHIEWLDDKEKNVEIY
jgi:thiamine biosynthesis lipoprotein